LSRADTGHDIDWLHFDATFSLPLIDWLAIAIGHYATRQILSREQDTFAWTDFTASSLTNNTVSYVITTPDGHAIINDNMPTPLSIRLECRHCRHAVTIIVIEHSSGHAVSSRHGQPR
jgi:hypothetical protein